MSALYKLEGDITAASVNKFMEAHNAGTLKAHWKSEAPVSQPGPVQIVLLVAILSRLLTSCADFFKKFSQKNSICAATAPATGTLRAVGLGTAATGPPPRLRKCLSEIGRKRTKSAVIFRKSIKNGPKEHIYHRAHLSRNPIISGRYAEFMKMQQ